MNKKCITLAAVLCLIMSAGITAGAKTSAIISGYSMGSSTVDVTPPIGVPLAGFGSPKRRVMPWDILGKNRYAHFFKPSIGVHDPIRSKALVIEEAGKKLLFISLDVIGLETVFVNDIKDFAATLGIENVIVSATHTHSGPGALGRNPYYEILATDRFVPEVYDHFLEGVKQSIVAANASLEPVTLYRTEFNAVGIQLNRRTHPGRFDPQANLIYGKNAKDEVVGGLINLGVHSTALMESNLYFTADMAGGIERHLTNLLNSKHTILFMNGAEGDVAPDAEGFAAIESKSAEFAATAAMALGQSVEIPLGIQVRRATFKMPKGKLDLKNCGLNLPWPIHNLKVGGRRLFPREFELSQIELGDVFMMSWPGEPTTALGLEGKKLAEAAGYHTVLNLGLTNGYMGYFLMEDEFPEGGYEVCVSYHGPKAGPILLKAHQELFKL